jgi:hypothetical protein
MPVPEPAVGALVERETASVREFAAGIGFYGIRETRARGLLAFL